MDTWVLRVSIAIPIVCLAALVLWHLLTYLAGKIPRKPRTYRHALEAPPPRLARPRSSETGISTAPVANKPGKRCLHSNELPWTALAEGITAQVVVQGGRQVRVVEFAVGFREMTWCSRGHTGYVLSGRLELEFADGTEVVSAGDILLINAGEADKHCARVIEGPVRLFLVEEG
jgi:hypothetical protein